MWASLSYEMTHEIQTVWGGDIVSFRRAVAVFFQRCREMSAVGFERPAKLTPDLMAENQMTGRLLLAGTREAIVIPRHVMEDRRVPVLIAFATKHLMLPPSVVEVVQSKSDPRVWTMYIKGYGPTNPEMDENRLWRDVISYSDLVENTHLATSGDLHKPPRVMEATIAIKDASNKTEVETTIDVCPACTLNHVFWRVRHDIPHLVQTFDCLHSDSGWVPHYRTLTSLGVVTSEKAEALRLEIHTDRPDAKIPEDRPRPYSVIPSPKFLEIFRVALGGEKISRVENLSGHAVRAFAQAIREAIEVNEA